MSDLITHVPATEARNKHVKLILNDLLNRFDKECAIKSYEYCDIGNSYVAFTIKTNTYTVYLKVSV